MLTCNSICCWGNLFTVEDDATLKGGNSSVGTLFVVLHSIKRVDIYVMEYTAIYCMNSFALAYIYCSFYFLYLVIIRWWHSSINNNFWLVAFFVTCQKEKNVSICFLKNCISFTHAVINGVLCDKKSFQEILAFNCKVDSAKWICKIKSCMQSRLGGNHK